MSTSKAISSLYWKVKSELAPMVAVMMLAAVLQSAGAATVSFDFTENRGNYEIVGSGGQRFMTKWSSCSADKIYAYRDGVRLVGVGTGLNGFPVSSQDFVGLDWEQRAPQVKEGAYVVFLNAEDQFLCVRVDDVKVKSRGDSQDLLSIEYRVYPTDTESAQAIVKEHEDRKPDYVFAGLDEGNGSFCTVNNSGHLTFIGARGQKFVTMWSSRSADSVYAYRDYVRLIGVGGTWTDFPASAQEFRTGLDWEQRAPVISKGGHVVFMNDKDQFLFVRVNDIKVKSRGDDENRIYFDYRIYDADTVSSGEIISDHNDRKIDYETNGRDSGTVSFRFDANNGHYTITGSGGARFVTMWSECGADSVYAYRDGVKAIGVGGGWAELPGAATAFPELDWGMRAASVKKGDSVVFRNNDNQFLCARVVDVKVKSRGESENLLVFDYRIYGADSTVAEVTDLAAGDDSDDSTVKVDADSSGTVCIPPCIDPEALKLKLIKYISKDGRDQRIDISGLLSLPRLENGMIDLSKAEIKPEIMAEILDIGQGAKVNLDSGSITIETVNTREGLTYEFFDADSLEGLSGQPKETKVGDGRPFKPDIKPNGSRSRFFRIKVRK